ncbi:MAG: aminotransferase class V-fold PLP-dependent enzyme, partial [Gemmatimonadota bacterium]
MTAPDRRVETVTMGAHPLWGDDWEAVRRLWLLDPAVAHCNHGSYGAVPAAVLAAQEELRRRMAANPVSWFERELPGQVTAARAEIARFLGAEPGDVALVSNASAGVSAVCQSLALAPEDEVVCTDHGYGAVSNAIERLCARTGAVRAIARVPEESADDEVVEILSRHCSRRTRLVVLDEVTAPTARHFPVEAAARVAHGVGAAILVDGAHALGMLPVQVPQLGVDFWVGNLHKWACAPAGAAALWV